jgi:hypothetical protein
MFKLDPANTPTGDGSGILDGQMGGQKTDNTKRDKKKIYNVSIKHTNLLFCFL